MNSTSLARPGNLGTPQASSPRRHVSRVAAALLLALALGSGYAVLGPLRPNAAPAAVAQSGDLAGHPVVGVWRLVDDIADPLGDNYGLFRADGTYVEVGVGTTFLGVWRPTGENTLEVLQISGSLNFPGEAYKPGTELTHTAHTYDPQADTLAGVYSPTLSDASGEVFASGAQYSLQGTRVDFESVAASTPTP